MNEAFALAVQKPVHLGKLAKVEDDRNLKFARYLTPDLGPPPVEVLRTPMVESIMGGNDWGMMKNDQYGDCTCAALGHAEQVWQAIRHAKNVRPTDDQVFELYIPKTGSDDTGRSEYEVLKYVKKHNLWHHRVYAWAEIGLNSLDYVKHAIDLFGLAYIGIALPISAQQQTVWDVTTGPDSEPGSWGGHAIDLVDYDTVGPTCITWGRTLKMTWSFFTRYCDEAYAILDSEWLQRGKSIAGFDKAALISDLEAIH